MSDEVKYERQIEELQFRLKLQKQLFEEEMRHQSREHDKDLELLEATIKELRSKNE